MAAKILILIGSPRKNGNSATLAECAAQMAREAGATTDTVVLHDLDITPCDGCGVCRESVEAECVIRDDMGAVYPKLRRTDAIMIATPIYRYDLRAQTKLLIDRCYALGSKDGGNALNGKRFAFIVVYGGKDPFSAGAATAMRCFHDTFARKACGMQMIHGSAGAIGDAERNQRLVSQAEDLGRFLAGEDN